MAFDLSTAKPAGGFDLKTARPANTAAPAQKPYNPVDEMGSWQRALAGAGGGMMHVARGVGQLVGAYDQSDIDEASRLERPLNETTAGFAGDLAGRIAATIPAVMIPGAATLPGAAVIGAGTGLLTTEGDIGDRALGGTIGAAAGPLGLLVGRGVGSVLRSSGASLTAGQNAAKAAGDRLGLRLTPGYASGSKPLQRMEAMFESNPVSSGGFDALKEGNQKALNRIAAKAIGEDSDELSAPVIGNAFDRIGKVYESVGTKQIAPLDSSAITGRLVNIIDDHAGTYASNADVASNPLFTKFSDFTDSGQATQEQLSKLSSNLGKAVKNQFTNPSGDRQMGSALAEVKELVDDALESSLTGNLAKEFGEARGQYRTLMQLTKNSNVVNPASGNVNGNALARVLQNKDVGGYLRGKNTSDLYDAARFSQAFPRIVGDSGTATRSMGAADYLTALPARALSEMYLSAPGQAASRGAAALGGGARSVLTRAGVARLGQESGLPIGLTVGPQAAQSARQK